MKSAPVYLTQQEHEFIENVVKTFKFAWYYYPHQTHTFPPAEFSTRTLANTPFFAHTLLLPSVTESGEGEVNSEHFGIFNDIFQRWLAENGIEFTAIHRASVNLVTAHDEASEFTYPHVDHVYAHKNWLMYLNTVDHAETLVFDSQGQIISEIPCVQYTAVTFDGQLHAHRLPTGNQRRMVVVFTYS